MKTKIIAAVLYTIFVSVASILFYIWLAGDPVPIVKEVEVIKTVDKIVYRDYKMADCCGLLEKYDKSPMIITYKVNGLKSEYTAVDLTWRLYERSGEQEIRVPVGQSGGWKLYVGAGLGAVAVGGLVMLLK